MSNIEKTRDYSSENKSKTPFYPTDRISLDSSPFAVKNRKNLPSKTKRKTHLLFSPIHYEPGYAYPMIVWLHGPGSDESELFRIMPQISLRNYVAAAPRGLTYQESATPIAVQRRSVMGTFQKFIPLYDWPESDVGIYEAENRIFETIEKAQKRYHIAANRIFLVGMNSGGTMALRVGTRHPERFAGIVSLSGRFPENHLPLKLWSQIRDIPILMTVGEENPIFSQELLTHQLRLFHAAGMSVAIRQYKTAEESTPKMFQDANRWMMDQITGSQS